MAKKGLSRRSLLGGLACLALAGGIGARIAYVNATAPQQIETVEHPMGEWLDLDGAYIHKSYMENTEPYSVRISEAELMSYNTYVERYALNREPIEGLDSLSIVCLTMDIRNMGGSNGGGLSINEMDLIPKRLNERFILDMLLFCSTEKALQEVEDIPPYGISIEPNTEYTVHLPYVMNAGTVEYNGQKVDWAWLQTIYDTEFHLIVSNMPERNVINISL